jgi:hypothetical protein
MKDLRRFDEATDIAHLPDVRPAGRKRMPSVKTVLGKAENVPLRKAGFDRCRIYSFGRCSVVQLMLSCISSTVRRLNRVHFHQKLSDIFYTVHDSLLHRFRRAASGGVGAMDVEGSAG